MRHEKRNLHANFVMSIIMGLNIWMEKINANNRKQYLLMGGLGFS